MREIRVGIRIDPNEGLSFTGLDEVNGLINRGGMVVELKPAGAVMRKLGEEENDSRWTLSGCDMTVVVDDTAVATSPKTLEHNRLFQEGHRHLSPYMQIVDRQSRPAASPQDLTEVEQGISLLKEAIEINPANWSAYWLIGKAYQALDRPQEACDAFQKSYALQKGNPDVAREYMFECLKMGFAERGIAAARHAVTLKPDDPGLTANLALALLIGGILEEAGEVIVKALTMAPDDKISQNLDRRIADVRAGRRSQPKTIADLENA